MILVGIGVVITPIRYLIYILTIFLPLFTSDQWELLTRPHSEFYHPYWEPLLIFECLTNIVLTIWSCYLIYLFFTKDYRFPRTYIMLAFVSVIVIILDAYFLTFVMDDVAIFDQETTRELFRSLFALLVWGTYLTISDRSKQTFVENQKAKDHILNDQVDSETDNPFFENR